MNLNRKLSLAALAAVFACAAPASAADRILLTDGTQGVQGSSLKQLLLADDSMSALRTSTRNAYALATGDDKLFWSDFDQTNFSGDPGSIGVADMDGGNAQQDLITGLDHVGDIEVKNSTLYWADFTKKAIGRAGTDGSGADPLWLSLGEDVFNVAVSDTHIYWTTRTMGFFPAPTEYFIGRAKLDGTEVDGDWRLVPTPAYDVDVVGSKLLYANSNGNIGRMNLDGSGQDDDWIGGNPNLSTKWIAATANHVYWVNQNTQSIGCASLDGTGVNQSFYTGTYYPEGILAFDSPGDDCRAPGGGGGQPVINQPTLTPPAGPATPGVARKVVVRNPTNHPVNVLKAEVVGDGFTVALGTCATAILPQGTCALDVTYTGSASGRATLRVTTSASGMPIELALEGAAISVSTPAATATAAAPRAAAPTPTAARICRSRRRLTITLPKLRKGQKYRSAQITFGAKKLRKVKPKRGKVAVDLRGQRKGKAKVTIVAVTSAGKTVKTTVRGPFRTCVTR